MSLLVQQIQTNTITNLGVSDTDDGVVENIHQVIEALEKNNTIISFTFNNDFLGCLRDDARSRLINTLEKVESLREVHLEGAMVRVSDIAQLPLESLDPG